MTPIDWWLVGGGLLFIAWLVYVMWRVQRWADRDFDRHTGMAAALVNPPPDEAEARRRHPAARALGGAKCPQCDAPGPAREHLHRRGDWS